jgi:FtsP/CotA-like multicopper oxidase with cupredoxin domain
MVGEGGIPRNAAMTGGSIERLGSWRTGPDSLSSDEPTPDLTPFLDRLPIPPSPHRVPPFTFGDRRPDQASAAGAAYFRLVQEEAAVSLHAELPRTWIWRYRDAAPDAAPWAGVLGPTFRCFIDEPPAAGGPVVIRVKNALPDPHRGFGLNCTTMHLLGGHVAARSDGFPEDPADEADYRPVIGPGEHFDHSYELRDVGHTSGLREPGERPSTLLYRDNLLDFAAPNVYRGLTGLFLVHDEFDADDETGARHPETNLRLPSGACDVPLVVRDVRVASNGRLVYMPSDRQGARDERCLVNGKVQPYLAVGRRKYRFRIANASVARLFALQLADERGRCQRFDYLIATGGGLLARPIPDVDHILLAASERREVVVDFARFAAGSEVFLVDRLDHEGGFGPPGSCGDPQLGDVARRRPILKFLVEDDAAADPSRVPEALRPGPARLGGLQGARRRACEFRRKQGVWSINGVVADVDVPLATVRRDEVEVWSFENPSGAWLPIRVSRAVMRVLSRNGGPPLAHECGAAGRSDCVLLAPGDRVEVALRVRDYPGRALLASGNLAQADSFLRARVDVV